HTTQFGDKFLQFVSSPIRNSNVHRIVIGLERVEACRAGYCLVFRSVTTTLTVLHPKGRRRGSLGDGLHARRRAGAARPSRRPRRSRPMYVSRRLRVFEDETLAPLVLADTWRSARPKNSWWSPTCTVARNWLSKRSRN